MRQEGRVHFIRCAAWQVAESGYEIEMVKLLVTEACTIFVEVK